MTAVVVAVVGGFFGLATIWFQAKVHRENRSDHASTAAKVDALVEGQSDMAADLRDVKADVRETKHDLRALNTRVDNLEGAA